MASNSEPFVLEAYDLFDLKPTQSITFSVPPLIIPLLNTYPPPLLQKLSQIEGGGRGGGGADRQRNRMREGERERERE